MSKDKKDKKSGPSPDWPEPVAGAGEAAAPEAGAAAAPGRQAKFLRIVVMVGGALAAPSLALAAFFFSDTRDPAPAKQAGVLNTPTKQGGATTTTSGGRPTPSTIAPTSTTTTTAPLITSAAGLRDPFAPLVSTTPPPGPPGR